MTLLVETLPVQYLQDTLMKAIQYADANGIEIPLELRLRCRCVVVKAVRDVGSITAGYSDTIESALTTYFDGGSVSSPRNQFKRAAVEALGDAFDTGYSEGGGELPVSGDPLEWLNARIEQEFSHIDSLFEQAKQLRKEEGNDPGLWIAERVDGYTRTVSALYNSGQLWAKKNKMLTWRLGNTEKHCKSCSKLDSKRHKASWYLARNYIPRQPGASMECGGYFCDCHLEDDEGNEVTI